MAIGHQFTKFANVFSHQRFPLYGIQLQNNDRENFDDETLVCQICQNFPPSKICAIRYLQPTNSGNQYHHVHMYTFVDIRSETMPAIKICPVDILHHILQTLKDEPHALYSLHDNFCTSPFFSYHT